MDRFFETNYVIVADFDGTITREDSNALLVEYFGNSKNAQIEDDFISGVISNREAFYQHFESMHITLEEYLEFIRLNINIDPGFDEFLKRVHMHGVPFLILSGGYHQAVECVLGEKRLQGVKVFANDLSGEPYITPQFESTIPDCIKSFGPCGNCKRDCLKGIRHESKRKILYIGDGLTDRCAVEEADILFAKSSLAAYCDAQGISYIHFDDFSNITNYLRW